MTEFEKEFRNLIDSLDHEDCFLDLVTGDAIVEHFKNWLSSE